MDDLLSTSQRARVEKCGTVSPLEHGIGKEDYAASVIDMYACWRQLVITLGPAKWEDQSATIERAISRQFMNHAMD